MSKYYVMINQVCNGDAPRFLSEGVDCSLRVKWNNDNVNFNAQVLSGFYYNVTDTFQYLLLIKIPNFVVKKSNVDYDIVLTICEGGYEISGKFIFTDGMKDFIKKDLIKAFTTSATKRWNTNKFLNFCYVETQSKHSEKSIEPIVENRKIEQKKSVSTYSCHPKKNNQADDKLVCSSHAGEWSVVGVNNEAIDLYIVLNHDKEYTWGGVYCPRFSNIEKYFAEELASVQSGEFICIDNINDNKKGIIDLVCLIERRINERVNQNEDFRELGIKFNCQILHNVRYKKDGTQKEFANKELSEAICSELKGVIFLQEVEAWSNAGDKYFSQITMDFKSEDGSEIIFHPRGSRQIETVELQAQNNIYSFEKSSDYSAIYKIKKAISLDSYQRIFQNGWELIVKIRGIENKVIYKSDSKPVKVQWDERFAVGGRHAKNHILFLDMGSTRTKFMLVPVTETGQMDAGKIKKWVMPTFDRDEMATRSFLSYMFELQQFLKDKKIPEQEIKSHLVRNGELMEDFFVTAVKSFAKSSIAIDEKVVLTDVWWSFPLIGANTGLWGFDIEKNISDKIKYWVNTSKNHCFHLVPEHIALKNMFIPIVKNVLPALFRVINDSISSQITDAESKAENKKEKLEEHNFANIFAWLRNRKRRNVNQRIDDDLNQRKEEIRKQRENEFYITLGNLCNLFSNNVIKDFILLDGGGYTMDSYCEIDGRLYGLLSSSFECGGETLILNFWNRLKDEKLITEQTSLHSIRVSIMEDHMSSRSKEIWRQTVNNVYEAVLNLYNNSKMSKIKLVVFSGQVTKNSEVRECFQNIKENINKDCFIVLNSHLVSEGWIAREREYVSSSIIWELFDFAEAGKFSVRDDDIRKHITLFRKVVERNDIATSDYDILGGMLNMSMQKGKRG